MEFNRYPYFSVSAPSPFQEEWIEPSDFAVTSAFAPPLRLMWRWKRRAMPLWWAQTEVWRHPSTFDISNLCDHLFFGFFGDFSGCWENARIPESICNFIIKDQVSPSVVALTSALRPAVEGLCEGDGGGAAPL